MNISSRCRFARAYEMHSIGFIGSIGQSRLRFAQRDAFDWVHWQYWTTPMSFHSSGWIRLGSLAVLDTPVCASLNGMNST